MLSFDKCMYKCNPNSYKDIGHIRHPRKLLIIVLSQSPPLLHPKQELLYNAGKNPKQYNHFGRRSGNTKENITLTLWSRYLIPRHLSKRNENVIHRKLYKNIHSFTHNSPKLEMAQVFIHKGLDKQTMVYSRNWILLGCKKERTTDKYNNTHKFQRHCDEWKKLYTKWYMWCNFI